MMAPVFADSCSDTRENEENESEENESMDTPTPDEVRMQLENLCKSRGFVRAPKLQQLLRLIVEETLNGGSDLSEKFIGHKVKDDFVFEKDSDRQGYPKTRANLGHVRKRLDLYRETDGYRDSVVIKMNVGSYVPVFLYNNAALSIPALDTTSERLILRAKAAIDARTYSGAERAYTYWEKLETNSENPRSIANAAFIMFALAAFLPMGTRVARVGGVEKWVAPVREGGFEPWELTFADACMKAVYQQDWKAALGQFEVAVEKSGGEARGYWWYTALLASQGQTKKAIEILDEAVQHFARTNIATRTDLALLQVMDGQYSEAEETLSASLDFASESNPLLACTRTICYEAQNKIESALKANEGWLENLRKVGNTTDISAVLGKADWHFLVLGMLSLVAARGGAATTANQLLERIMYLKLKSKHGASSSVEAAIALIGVGRRDEAVAWLNRAAFEEYEPLTMWLHIFPPLRHLRDHPGFRELLARLKLPFQR